jgi:hypothetical protein
MDTYYFVPDLPRTHQGVQQFFETQRRALIAAIQQESDERLVMTSLPVYSSALVSKFRLEPLTIHYEQLSVSDSVQDASSSYGARCAQAKVQVVTLHLPFIGNTEVLKLVAGHAWSQQDVVQAHFAERELLVDIKNTRRDIDWMKSEKRRVLDVVALVVAWCNREVEEYNQSLVTPIEPLVAKRIARIQEERRLLQENREMLTALTEPYVPTVTLSPKEVVTVPPTNDDWDDEE